MLPTHRSSRSRRGKRRSHDRLRDKHAVMCPNCGTPKFPHATCRNCGYVRPGLMLKLHEEA